MFTHYIVEQNIFVIIVYKLWEEQMYWMEYYEFLKFKSMKEK